MVVVALLAPLILLDGDTVVVRDRHDLALVEYGWPVPWMAQDQSRLDPPFPFAVSPGSPWDSPTSIDLSAYLLSAGAVLAGLVFTSVLVVALGARLRSTGRVSTMGSWMTRSGC